MQKSGKLELTWVGKYEQKEIEPRILVENPDLSYGDQDTGNMLIHGDNLIALKALEQDYAGKIKCIYIDPPYNTGSAFEYYDDGLEHSEWLNMMRPRLEILKKLLSDDGSIFIQIDYNEQAYLKVLCDEIFGRNNFLTMITCKVKAPSGIASGANAFFDCSEYILAYCKDKISFSFHSLKIDSARLGSGVSNVTNFYNQLLTKFEVSKFVEFATFEGDVEIKELSEDDFSVDTIKKPNRTEEMYYNYYNSIFATAAISGGRDKKILAYLKTLSNYDKNKIYSYSYVASQGKNKGKLITNYIYKDRNILFLKDYVRVDNENRVVYKQDIVTNIFYNDWWQGLTAEGGIDFKNGQKPEKLLEILFSITTNEGDLVMDSFLGSGTTIAAAHKMRRKWIGIEMGDHAYSHCKFRIDQIIKGVDFTGISKTQNWKGGGGYKFYELAPSLLVPNPKLPTIKQINPEYTFEMMCEAICKLEGFKYKPDGKFHGKSSEQRFIHITKEFVNGEYINSLLANLGEEQSLLVYGMKIQSGLRLPDNIIVKKIPKDLLDKCTFESEVK